MEGKKYNTTWIQQDEEMPNGQCPKCEGGQLYNSKYFEGVYCSECKWQFRRSKFQKTGDIVKERVNKTSDYLIMEEIQGLKKHLDERLDKLGEYLKANLEK